MEAEREANGMGLRNGHYLRTTGIARDWAMLRPLAPIAAILLVILAVSLWSGPRWLCFGTTALLLVVVVTGAWAIRRQRVTIWEPDPLEDPYFVGDDLPD